MKTLLQMILSWRTHWLPLGEAEKAQRSLSKEQVGECESGQRKTRMTWMRSSLQNWERQETMVIPFVTHCPHWMIDIKGLDEDLADSVDKAFYESYKTWKNDHSNASTRQQVDLPIRIIFWPQSRFVSGWGVGMLILGTGQHRGFLLTPSSTRDLLQPLNWRTKSRGSLS